MNDENMIFDFSIHALLAESDDTVSVPNRPKGHFLSTLSLRRATSIIELIKCGFVFLSTLSLRRATIHFYKKGQANKFSIHALLAESDNERFKAQVSKFLFLSTLSLRRATSPLRYAVSFSAFSIHALLAESDR